MNSNSNLNRNQTNLMHKRNLKRPLSLPLQSSLSSTTTTNSNNIPQQSQTKCNKHHQKINISILHSKEYIQTLYTTFHHIHQDRDLLYSYLLYYCGFIKDRPSFLNVVKPSIATREELESFHDVDYLDLLDSSLCHDDFHYGDNNNGGCDFFDNDCGSNDEGENSKHGNGNESSTTCTTSTSTPVDMNDNILIHETKSSSSSKFKNNNPKSNQSQDSSIHSILDSYGLIDDCPLPTTIQKRHQLWKYCLSVAGASLHAATLLLLSKSSTSKNNYANAKKNNVDVAINFGGGRHHAFSNKAGGFCYINDVVLAIQRLLLDNNEQKYTKECHGLFNNRNKLQHVGGYHPQEEQQRRQSRVLYLDLDIHHCDGVQSAFYNTNQVLTISLHRYTPGFYPSTSGSTTEKGKYQTRGVGYNLNIPMPRNCTNVDFIYMWKKIVRDIVPYYDPDYVVLCVGADGLRDDDLVKDTCEGWNLTPEGIAYCVKLLALYCAGCDDWEENDDDNDKGNKNDSTYTNIPNSSSPEEQDESNDNTTKKRMKMRKLLVLGGGGYNPTNTARTFLLCTAAACEGARRGILNELPKDIPKHEYFARYGPSFELYSKEVLSSLHRHMGKYQNEMDYRKELERRNDEYTKTLKEGIEAIYLQSMFLRKNVHNSNSDDVVNNFCAIDNDADDLDLLLNSKVQKKKVHSRRKRQKLYCK